MIHTPTKLKAWVEVSDDDGTTWTVLEEYKTETGHDYAKTHIESKSGQRFRMCVEKTKDYGLSDDLSFDFYCDGHKANSCLQKSSDNVRLKITGLKSTSTTVLPFAFSDVRLMPLGRDWVLTVSLCASSYVLHPVSARYQKKVKSMT